VGSDPGHAKNDKLSANLGSEEASVKLLVDSSYLESGVKDMGS
jgi:hypothetical protein